MVGDIAVFPKGINQGIVVMENEIQNSISTNELYKEYDWYQNTFPKLVKDACDDFFASNFDIEFVGLSKNINCLLDNEACFVTKIRINKDYDVYFRMTEKAISIILNTVLGQSKNKFNINKISELEAKIITSFNSTMFDAIKEELDDPDPSELKRTNFDVIHLSFIIKSKDEYSKSAGKIFITIPQVLVEPEEIESEENKFSDESFPNAETFAKIIVGKTRFSLYDVKNLEQDDLVVFENSNIEHLTLSIFGNQMDIKLEPNMDILIPETDDGGDNMSDDSQKNIWDSIEVDMYAEFDSVKITLGELKNIETGLVVDLTSLYNNCVTLKVEGKPIANGSLVIVNDRYGVKINEVLAGNNAGISPSNATPQDQNSFDDEDEEEEDEENYSEEGNEEESEGEDNNEENDEDFDYSDFELEDENI